MKKIVSCLFMIFISCNIVNAFESNYKNLTALQALKRLREGNQRFQTMHLKHPDQTLKTRMSLTKEQHPFAVILTCSDSRVPPSIIFDQGLGDIFEIRNAGNVIDEHVIGSIEYAVCHLGVNLVIVMGHQDCGAVTAAVKHAKHETKYIQSLIKSINPALKHSEHLCKNKESLLDETIKTNAIFVKEQLLHKDSTLQELAEKRGLKIIPAYYHLDTGYVEFLN